MAVAKLHSPKFAKIELKASEAAGGWRGFKQLINDRQTELKFSDRSVYVIRLVRPFTIPYGIRHSPTLYIGRGSFQSRFTSHLKWIRQFASHLPNVKIEVRFANPTLRGRGNRDLYKDLEAELIARFKKRYDRIPIFNRREESSRGRLFASEVSSVLHPGKGTGFHWALIPVGSNPLKSKIKEVSLSD